MASRAMVAQVSGTFDASAYDADVDADPFADDSIARAPDAPTAAAVKRRDYRKMLRAASSYASFNVRKRNPGKTSVFKTGRAIVCAVLMFACAVMLLVEFAENDWQTEPLSVNPTLGVSVEVLLRLGAKRADLILDGQWYRLVAPIFLHAGVLHFAFNMFGLYQIGFPLERQYGSLAVAAILLLGGLQGVVWSAIFSPNKVGVGASGAIFALFGSAWSELLLNWSLYKGSQCTTVLQLTVATAVNLLIGLLPFLDNFAHLAGFATGVVVGFGVLVSDRYTRHGDKKERKRYQVALQAASVLCTPVMLVVSLFILFFGVDAQGWCEWCSYLSCVPFPPGDSPWWTCGECSDAGVTAQFVNATHIAVNCPSDDVVQALAPPGLLDDNSLLIGVCEQVCPT